MRGRYLIIIAPIAIFLIITFVKFNIGFLNDNNHYIKPDTVCKKTVPSKVNCKRFWVFRRCSDGNCKYDLPENLILTNRGVSYLNEAAKNKQGLCSNNHTSIITMFNNFIWILIHIFGFIFLVDFWNESQNSIFQYLDDKLSI